MLLTKKGGSMKKLLVMLGVISIFMIGNAYAKSEIGAWQAGSQVIYGHDTESTIKPIKVSSDGTVATSGAVTIASMPSTPVTGTFWQTNQAVDLNAGSNVVSGQTTVTTATTRVALAGSQACLSVTVKAKPTNTGYIYVGTAAGVSSTVGFILSAKEAVTIDTDNLADIGLDSSVSGEGVSYIAVIK